MPLYIHPCYHSSLLGLAATLGAHPSPGQLSSIPIFTTRQGGPAFSAPSPTTVPSVTWAPGGHSAGQLPQMAQPTAGQAPPISPISSATVQPSQPGLSLSPAMAPVPRRLVNRVSAGQFIDMRERPSATLLSSISPAHQVDFCFRYSFATPPRRSPFVRMVQIAYN